VVGQTRRSGAKHATLTARQLEVLHFVARGHSNKAIAVQLGVSENGVKAHIARLLLKFGVPNRAALVRVALPGYGSPTATPGDLYLLLRETLIECVGLTATEALLRRALKRAASREPHLERLVSKAADSSLDWEIDGAPGFAELRGILRELCSLLIDMTGPVVVDRLKRHGLVPDGDAG
jgi:DNA-binding CsgD family transcriptional regulator